MNTFYAHTREDLPRDEWQPLKEHLRGTAAIAEEIAVTGLKGVGRVAGMLHDLGKYQAAFQRYLVEGGRRGSVPHAVWGAGYAKRLCHNEISIAIDGHHKGLPNLADWQNDISDFISGEKEGFDDVVQSFLNDSGLTPDVLKKEKMNVANPLERELLTRLIFSVLTDADWLDTEKFCSPDIHGKRTAPYIDHDLLINKLENEIEKKPKTGELNKLRSAARLHAISMAGMRPGFYSMNLPTGMGKTLASISWALRHAREHDLKRIIIVLPFINIIDQTSQILKEIFGDEMVLEHHSGNNDNFVTQEELSDLSYAQRFAGENWEYPIIVTTTVQFFESLFSNRPSKCRKVHNIVESVVIFDEVQTLPKKLLTPTLTMLNNLRNTLPISFLFCTATQPAFEKRNNFNGIDSITPLVENPAMLFKKTRRVSYYSYNNAVPVNIENLIEGVKSENNSILAIFNTKKSAANFFSTARRENRWETVYHLSTAMCPQHRKKTIHSIREDLKKKQKILVASTQLIEAGVDFDFPCVFREMAPLESIIQSAGRCNREGKMQNSGNVYIFKLEDGGFPDKLYQNLTGFASDIIQADLDKLHNHDFYTEYYQAAVNLFVNTDANNINDSRKKFNFEDTAMAYRIIDKSTESIFIRDYSEESKQLYQSLEYKPYLSRTDFRKMQEYSVQVYQNFLKKNKDSFTEPKPGLKIWNGSYDSEMGILSEQLTADQCVV